MIALKFGKYYCNDYFLDKNNLKRDLTKSKKKFLSVSLYLFILVFVKGKKRNWSSLSAEVLTSPIVCWTLQSPLDDSGEGASWG